MTALTMQKGNASNGRAVFARSCTACHKMGNGEGQDYGPNVDKVGTRLTRYKIVESIIDPNAEVDKKYLSTRVDLLDGKSISGLVVGRFVFLNACIGQGITVADHLIESVTDLSLRS